MQGRPKGSLNEHRRENCRVCGSKLNSNDPQRNTVNGKRYLGECSKCASERITVDKWKKKGSEAIRKQIEQVKREMEMLEKALTN